MEGIFAGKSKRFCLQRSRETSSWQPRVKATPSDEDAPAGPVFYA